MATAAAPTISLFLPAPWCYVDLKYNWWSAIKRQSSPCDPIPPAMCKDTLASRRTLSHASLFFLVLKCITQICSLYGWFFSTLSTAELTKKTHKSHQIACIFIVKSAVESVEKNHTYKLQIWPIWTIIWIFCVRVSWWSKKRTYWCVSQAPSAAEAARKAIGGGGLYLEHIKREAEDSMWFE